MILCRLGHARSIRNVLAGFGTCSLSSYVLARQRTCSLQCTCSLDSIAPVPNFPRPAKPNERAPFPSRPPKRRIDPFYTAKLRARSKPTRLKECVLARPNVPEPTRTHADAATHPATRLERALCTLHIPGHGGDSLVYSQSGGALRDSRSIWQNRARSI